jgi:hypothetical protein
MNKRNTTYLLKEGWEGLWEAIWSGAHEDEWKLQRSRLKTATGDEDVAKKHEKTIRTEIGGMLLIEMQDWPVSHTRTKELREETFDRIMEKIGVKNEY